MTDIWGHSITDCLKRMWFLKSELYREYFKDCLIVYVPMWYFDFDKTAKNFSRLLEILEIDYKKFIPIREPIQFKYIVMPDLCFHSYGEDNNMKFTDEYVMMINQVKEFAIKHSIRIPQPFKKVFYFHGLKQQIGEERLARYFQSKGYAIIRPEQLTIDEQLNVLVNCESFATTLGSSSHNTIFLKNGTEVILIPRKYGLNDYQLTLDSVNDLNTNYIDSTLSIFLHNPNKHHGIFYYWISRQLMKYFGEEDKFKYTEEDYLSFITYLKISRQLQLQLDSESMEYYKEEFIKFEKELKLQKELLEREGIKLN